MRSLPFVLFLAAAGLAPATVRAQASAQAQPLQVPALQVPALQVPALQVPAPQAQPLQVPPQGASPGAPQAQNPQSPTDPAQPALPETPPTPPPGWVPKGVAELQALDKVNARHATLSAKIGEQVQYGTLHISVQACLVRPPNYPQDAAAFLSITDSSNESTNFRGWMFAGEPALSMLQHPVFDIRVTGCR